jgi:molybdopterin-guanine dinucleotide biosynthesis protein A
MNSLFTEITGVVLVGGKSLHMGQDKPFLLIDGLPAIERVMTTRRAGGLRTAPKRRCKAKSHRQSRWFTKNRNY